MSGIFKAYDIRGSYPDELNEDIAYKIGVSFVKLLNAGNIVVGRDMRLSSPGLAEAFIDGALDSGPRITDIGMVTTPELAQLAKLDFPAFLKSTVHKNPAFRSDGPDLQPRGPIRTTQITYGEDIITASG